MDQQASGLTARLQEKFPKMRPVDKAPTLQTINGFGMSVFGSRDADPETGTYVKTYCLCALYIPVLALGAYRVANADNGGWYFIGKEPLSGFAKGWNWAMLALAMFLAGSIGTSAYRSSPEYAAKQELKRADADAKAGKHLNAATAYRRLLDGTYCTAEANRGFQNSIEPCLKSDSVESAAKAVGLLARLPSRAQINFDPFKRGMELVEKFRPMNPDGALQIARALKTVNPKAKELGPLEIDLLKTVVAKYPENAPRAVELAVVYEDAKQVDDAVKVLTPLKSKLGDTEGARILGQHLLQEGENDAAYPLLFAYVQPRLASLRRVESLYTNAISSASKRAIDSLNSRGAPSQWYTDYQRASKDQQAVMVDEFVQKFIERDAGYNRAMAELRTANKIVPVTLDLGIVQVNRAQNLQSPEARKTELEAAEKTFLAIKGLAGETDEYRLFLGQVYYWLGKSKEGKALYDQLLTSRKRAFPIVIALAYRLRMVGEIAQARELSEEAYRTAKQDKDRYEAAALRANLQKDTDDRIAWLAKADPKDTHIQIELNGARGDKALEDQNKELAAQYLRKAIAGYESIAKTSAGLNNCGLAYLNLYRATSNPQDNQRGLALLEEAVTLDPGNSVLLINTLHVLLTHALGELIENKIRLAPLGEQGSFGALTYLYNDEQQRNEIYQRLRENASLKKSMSYLDRALLLAPKRLDLYQLALQIQVGLRDPAELQKLQQRFEAAAPDFREVEQEYADAYKGARDREQLDRMQKRMQRLQGLLQKPAVSGHADTLNYVKLQICYAQHGMWAYGAEVDTEKLVQSATEVYQAHRSSATRGNLSAAHIFRALSQLRRQNADLDALIKRTRRGVSSLYLVNWLMEAGGPIAEQLRGHADVQKALALLKETTQLFGSFPDPDDWAMFRSIDPGHATGIAEALKKNKTAQTIDNLQFMFSPMDSGHVLERYWTLQLFGEEQKAIDVYQAALKKGVPLPPMDRPYAKASR